jgi:hypothetical protein
MTVSPACFGTTCGEMKSFLRNTLNYIPLWGKNISFAEGRAHTPMSSLFHLPLSMQAHSQMLQLQATMQEAPINDSPDSWSYIWNSGIFSVK